MTPSQWVQILRCPETRQELKLAEPATVEEMNARIKQGQLRNRAGQVVNEPLEAGLIRADGKWLYPVRKGLPVMLIDEALVM